MAEFVIGRADLVLFANLTLFVLNAQTQTIDCVFEVKRGGRGAVFFDGMQDGLVHEVFQVGTGHAYTGAGKGVDIYIRFIMNLIQIQPQNFLPSLNIRQKQINLFIKSPRSRQSMI